MAFRRRRACQLRRFRTDRRCKDAVLGGDDVELFPLLGQGRDHPRAAGARYQPAYSARILGVLSVVVLRRRDRRCAWTGCRSAVCYLGIPRYFLRSIAMQFIKWNLTIEPKKRFYHKLQVYFLCRMIVESRR
jgi:hypothetical protein